MDVKQLLGAITAMIAKIAIAAAVIVVVFKLAVGAYDFGFQVFADIPKDEGDGRTVNVTVSEGQDSKDVGKYAETAMAWTVDAGIVQGTTSSTLSPKAVLPRQQCAVMLYRLSKAA